MSWPVSNSCNSAPNFSSQFSSARNSTEKCLLRFSDNFLNPADKICGWYEAQPFKRFRTIRYCKEKTTIGHEFILIRLQAEDGSDTDSYCRVERIGDPEQRFQVICIDGTIAEDYIQATPDLTGLTSNSYTVVEISFPLAFDLRDVLAICYGISKHPKAKKYTLQQYNCYFFSWTIIVALARACVDWDYRLNREHLQRIRDGIFKSINDKDPTRLYSLAYILSNDACPNSGNGEGHPLDNHIKSWLHSPQFSNSVNKMLQDTLWPSGLPSRVTAGLQAELSRESWASIGLLACEEDATNMKAATTQGEHNPNFENVVRKLTWKAIVTGFNTDEQAYIKILDIASPNIDICKRRIGHKVWCKCLMSAIRHPTNAYKSITSLYHCPADSSVYQPPESSFRDNLFIPPSFILGFCARLLFAGALISTSLALQIFVEYKLGGHGTGSGNTFRRTLRSIRSTLQFDVFRVAVKKGVSQRFIDHIVLSYAKDNLASICPELVNELDDPDDFERHQIKREGSNLCLGMLNNSLRELIQTDKEAQLSFLRPYFSNVIRDLANIIGGLQWTWEIVVWQQFSDGMVGAVQTELEGLVQDASMQLLFQAITTSIEPEPFQEAAPEVENSRNNTRADKGKSPLPFNEGVTHRIPKHEVWSYDHLLEFIKERIVQLSKRENEFAPFLKHVPLMKAPDICQKQIEGSMEEIWWTCWPRMVTRPKRGE